MRIALVSRYPRVDAAVWKLGVLEQLHSAGHALSVHYTRSGLADQVLAGVREFGFGALGRYRTARTATRDASSTAPRPTIGEWAAARGVPVHRHHRIADSDVAAGLREAAPDLVILAGADLVPPALLRIPRLGTINPHYGMLPAYRGMNVAEWSVFHDDPVGVTVHFVDAGIDTGDILEQAPVDVVDGDTLETIRAKQQRLAADLLVRSVGRVARGETSAAPQRPEEGRQFYRMHPVLRREVERKLATGAYRPTV